MRLLAWAAALALSCACATSVQPHPVPSPPGPKQIVLAAGDLPDVQKCAVSDHWADLMLQGEPEMLPTGFASWPQLQAAGATDAWMSLHAEVPAECPLLLGSSPPKGRLVYSAAIRFRGPQAAAASFGAVSQDFPVSPDFADRFQAAGGTVFRGVGTGFGPDSVVASIVLRGVPTYAAFWQARSFEAVVYADNLTGLEGAQAVARMNSRIA